MIVPEPPAVRSVVPETLVLPTVILPFEPAVVVRSRLPPEIVPMVVILPLSVTFKVPVPRLEVVIVTLAEESETMTVPEVEEALSEKALVLLIVALPVLVFSDNVPVSTAVPEV